MRVALVTCRELPAPDKDDEPLSAELPDAEWVVWDDPAVGWDAYDRVLIRSTWDYTDKHEAFVAWADAVGADRLRNPPEVVRFNADKRYMAELQGAGGFAVVETAFIAPGEAFVAPSVDGPFVVKPTVSAGSRDTQRFDAGGDPSGLVERIHAAGKTAMVQPYLDGVDEAGETSLICFGGTFSHAVRKGPMLAPDAKMDESGLFVAEEIRARSPSPEELAAGEAVLAWVRGRFGDLLYARIDLLPSADGPVLVELELVEPSLFFTHAPVAAVERYAALALAS